MARIERDREDIFQEATALVERLQVTAPGLPESTVVGFRRNGSASFYFGGDFVLQFNQNRQLRRAFDGNRLLKAVGGQWIALHRERTADQVLLHSLPLNPAQTSEFHRRARELLDRLRDALQSNTAHIDSQSPANRNVAEQVRQWLVSLGDSLPIADRPNAGQ